MSEHLIQTFQWLQRDQFLSHYRWQVGSEGSEQEFLFHVKAHRQTSQSTRESLVGANKLMGLNSQHVFPPHASLWDCTHPEDVVLTRTQTHNKHSDNIQNPLVLKVLIHRGGLCGGSEVLPFCYCYWPTPGRAEQEMLVGKPPECTLMTYESA